MADDEIELTLAELTQLALGTPEFNDVNISILHSLFNVLLKKLNCQHEQVDIGGFEGKSLQIQLAKSKVSPFPFNDTQVITLEESMQKLEALEVATGQLEAKLNDHFEKIRACDKARTLPMIVPRAYACYAHFCEDLCVIHEAHSKIGCQLILNNGFVRRTSGYIGLPVWRRIIEFEKQIETIHAELRKFLEKKNKQKEKIEQIKQCIREIAKLKNGMDAIEKQFQRALDEMEAMLRAKLHKGHAPALRKYIKDEFDAIQKTMDTFSAMGPCQPPRPQPYKEQCLSCGKSYAALLIAAKPTPAEQCATKKTRAKNKSLPSCANLDHEVSLHKRFKELNLETIEQQLVAQKNVVKTVLNAWQRKSVKVRKLNPTLVII